MLVQEVLDEFRSKVFDLVPKYSWDTPQALLYLDQAQIEASERALLLTDSSTTAVTQFATVIGTNVYSLHPSILRLRAGSINFIDSLGQSKPMSMMTENKVRIIDPNWQTVTGVPTSLITDLERGKVYVYPKPDQVGTIKYGVYRLPLTHVTDSISELEVPPETHYDLIWWMVHLAYQRRDPDKVDEGLVDDYEKLFTRAFGPKLRWRHWRHLQSDYSDRAAAAWL